MLTAAIGRQPHQAIFSSLDEQHYLVTQSGFHKGFLTAEQLMVMSLDDVAVSAGKPSAEAALHGQLYRLDPSIQAIWHVHSPRATVLSRKIGAGVLRLEGYELLKAFFGISSHDAYLEVPVVANSQDMDELQAAIEPSLHQARAHQLPCWAYMIVGHGVYAWAAVAPKQVDTWKL